MNQRASSADSPQPEPIKGRVSERWYYPVLCALGFAIVLAASITPPGSPHRWQILLVRLRSAAVIIPSLIGLLAAYAVRYFLQRRNAASTSRNS